MCKIAEDLLVLCLFAFLVCHGVLFYIVYFAGFFSVVYCLSFVG